MYTSIISTPSSLTHHLKTHHCFSFTNPIKFPFSFLTPTYLKLPSYSSSLSSSSSWLSSDDIVVHPVDDPFAGWDIPQTTPIPKPSKGIPVLLVAGFGASAAVLFAVVARFSLSKNGVFPLRRLFHRSSAPSVVEVKETKASDLEEPYQEEENVGYETSEVDSSYLITETAISERPKARIITFTVDRNQQEAVNILKKLKIIDDDVSADEICSRREYARWLVKTCSMLERNPKYKISASIALSGSVITAYEDVTFGDQDFDAIQALAEAGVVPSKLSTEYNLDEPRTAFSPDRFISRRDLIDWRAQLEYDFSMIRNQEILKTKSDLLDVREINSEKFPGLLMDMLAGETCLFRRVFGHIRRLQPDKPSTIAQAAVALTSGRMTDAINTELQRMQAEESSREAAKEELRVELLGRGEIQRYWADKMDEEKARSMEMERLYEEALEELEKEKRVVEDKRNANVKEKAAMECQKQLLDCLKVEVDEMSIKLVAERTEQIAEEEITLTLGSELQARKEGVLDAKSLLEAEIEALRMLRSWIEDEARKSQARMKVLKEVGRRWKWDGE